MCEATSPLSLLIFHSLFPWFISDAKKSEGYKTECSAPAIHPSAAYSKPKIGAAFKRIRTWKGMGLFFSDQEI